MSLENPPELSFARNVSPSKRLSRESSLLEDAKTVADSYHKTESFTSSKMRQEGTDKEGQDGEYSYVESEDDEYAWVDTWVEEKQDEDTAVFNTDPINCPICFSEAEVGGALTIPCCRHSFCTGCFRRYIEAQVGEGKADRISCPWIEKAGTKVCGQPIKRNILGAIFDSDEMKKLKHYAESAFVMSRADYYHCPTRDCDNIVHYKTGPPVIDCSKCKRNSCLKCGASPFHAGVTCEQWRTEHPEADPSVAAAGLTIRACRRCGNGIELAEGCLKMMCRCGYRFCFKCGSENAACGCTPFYHIGFTDNLTGALEIDVPERFSAYLLAMVVGVGLSFYFGGIILALLSLMEITVFCIVIELCWLVYRVIVRLYTLLATWKVLLVSKWG
jgi:hypothetical protein